MLGKIIYQERTKQKIKSKDLCAAVGIDAGHLSHIERGVRNPSKSVLAKICNELNLSYPFMLSISQDFVEDNKGTYDVTNYVPYNKTLYTENFKLIDCPQNIGNISLITKMKDTSMQPLIKNGALLFVQYVSSLGENDICLVLYNDEVLVREFSTSKNNIKLIPKNPSFETITISKNDENFTIVGKVLSY